MTAFTGEVHPVADLFPMLADDELSELAEDLKANGLLQPLVLDPDGRLLDGRNRLAACNLAGIEPEFTVYDGADPEAYALSVNIARRHLSTGARAIIAARAARLNGWHQNVSEAANRSDLSRSRLSDAFVVLDWAPEQADAVLAGAMPLSRAVDEARGRKRAAESAEAQMAQLRADASDLAEQVAEGSLSLTDAQREVERRAQVAARVANLPADLAERVEAGHVDIDEAEAIQRERRERIAANAETVHAALRTLGRMAGYPIAAELGEALAERGIDLNVLQAALAAIEGMNHDGLD